MSLAQRCGAQGAARQAACAAVLQRVRDEGLHSVRIVWGDLHGNFRGKTLVAGAAAAADGLADALQDGIGMVSTVLLKDTSDRSALPVFEPGALAALTGARPGELGAATGARPGEPGAPTGAKPGELVALTGARPGEPVAPTGFGAANNLLLLPDPASFTRLPWAPGTAWLRAEPYWPDGSAVAADPRRVLQAALAALAAQGHGLRCGLEVEFHIYRIAGEGSDPLAADGAAWPAEPPPLRLIHPGYNLLADHCTDMADEPLAIVRRTALGLNLPLRSLEIELGPSQVEAVFAPTDALTAADQMLLLRNGVRQALRRAGYHATFACRPPFAGAIASGWHLHQSLVDARGANAMQRSTPHADALHAQDARHVLSDAGCHWLAGLLAHARGMAALCAPTIPAYSRFNNSLMAPQAAVWGRDNRGAMLRVLGDWHAGTTTAGDPATRIENRMGEPMANPYLCIAAQVLAGLDGLQRRLQPPPATQAPYAAGQAPLPATLSEALDALEADPCLRQGLGEPMWHVFSAVKRQELARHAEADDKAAWERREYLGRF